MADPRRVATSSQPRPARPWPGWPPPRRIGRSGRPARRSSTPTFISGISRPSAWPGSSGAPALNRSFLWDDYRKASAGLNIVKAIYMEVDVDPSQQEQEARTVAELCHRGETSLAAAVISGRPASDRFADYIKPLAKDPAIRGVRQVLHGPGTPPGFCLRPAIHPGNPAPRRPGAELRPLHETRRAVRRGEADRGLPGHAIRPRPLRQRRRLRRRPHPVEARDRRGREAVECLLQDLGHRGLDQGPRLAARRSRPDHQPRPRASSGPIASSSAATGPSARWALRWRPGSRLSARWCATGTPTSNASSSTTTQSGFTAC